MVAALTIPTLMQKSQERANVSKLLKAYSVINHAFLSATEEYGPIEDWGVNTTDTGKKDSNGNSIMDYSTNQLVAARLKEFLQAHYYKDYAVGYTKSLDGRTIPQLSPLLSADYTIQLSDGVVLKPGWFAKDCSATGEGINQSFSGTVCSDYWVILNPSKHMRLGYDVFEFLLTKRGIIPNNNSNRCNINGTSVAPDQQGRGCTQWVVTNHNMEYLRCNDIFTSGKTKCD
ncbi:hypothetical protein KBA27_02130 [bacterium]|nr:hypothetical protein [bacterium]